MSMALESPGGGGVRRLAGRLGITEGQAYTLAIGLVLGLGTAAIGIPPTLRDRPQPAAAHAAPSASASAPPADAPTAQAPAAVPAASAPTFAGSGPLVAAPSYETTYEAPADTGPSWADGGSLGDVSALATTSGPPAGIAVDDATGSFYVALNDRVVRHGSSGAAERTYAVAGAGRLTGLRLDGDRLVALDAASSRVLALDVRSGAVRTLATVPDLKPCSNPVATDCELAAGGAPSIQDVAVDRAGTLYVSDAGQGIVWRLGAGAPTPWLRAPELLSADRNGPAGLAFDAEGNLLVTVAKSVVALTGAVYRVSVGADGSPGRPAEVFRSQPNTSLAGLAVGSSGRLYLTSPGDHALLVVEGGKVVRTITSPLLESPVGLAFRGRSLLVTNVTGGQGSVVRASADDAG